METVTMGRYVEMPTSKCTILHHSCW